MFCQATLPGVLSWTQSAGKQDTFVLGLSVRGEANLAFKLLETFFATSRLLFHSVKIQNVGI